MRATDPATTGVAIDVPDEITVELESSLESHVVTFDALRMNVPGADTSGLMR
jgi:hypothetical protein